MKLRSAFVVVALVLGTAAAEDPPAYRTAPELKFGIDHLALDLDVDLAGKAVTGTETLDVKAVSDLQTIHLDAVDLQVASVSVSRSGGQVVPASFTNDGQSLEIKSALRRGESARLKIAYSLREPRAGLHFYGPTPRDPNVPLQVWSQGEAQYARYWFPCLDSPCLRQTSEVTVHVPQGYEALSNGKLAEKVDEDGKKTRFHWVQEKSHVAYLMSLVVGKFYVGKDEWRGKPLLYYVPEKNKDDIERVFGHTKAMLDFFSDKIGVEYFWDKYSQCVVEQFGWGGMENVSATTLNARTLHDARAHLDYESDGLISHELAHQWWGDLLTCRDWAHIWLNEGFASYFEALWDEKNHGADEFEYNMWEKSRGATDDSCKRRPVVDHFYADPETVFDSRAYPKGAWVLHGLRRRLGDDAFWRSIHRYCQEHELQVVETIDLRRAFEAETGESLERYFHDLTERAGHPVLDVAYDWKDGCLEVVVKQTQKEEPFAVRTTILADGTEIPFTMQDEREKRIVVVMAARPKMVYFDPHEGTLKELTEHKGDDQWQAQLAGADNPVSRIRAAQALCDSHKPANVEAVANALEVRRTLVKDERPMTVVAIEAARALSKAGGDTARDALVKAVAHPDPKVRRVAIEGLASFRRDEKVIAAVRSVLEKGDPSYYVEAQAVSTIARVQADDARAWLEKALQKPSHNEVIREYALDAIAALEDPSMLPTLEKYATQAGDWDMGIRRHAVSVWARVAALPTVTDEARQKVVARLAKMVDEEGLRVRQSAIDALGGLGKEAVAALPSIEAAEKNDGEGRVRETAKRAAERIKAQTPPAVEITRLREEVQRLKESEEKLQKRLERVEAHGQEKARPARPAEREPD